MIRVGEQTRRSWEFEVKKKLNRAILRVSPEFLGMFFTGSYREIHVQIKAGLPKDARFIGANYNHERNTFDLCYESKEFADTPDGEELPVLPRPEINEYSLSRRIKPERMDHLVKGAEFGKPKEGKP